MRRGCISLGEVYCDECKRNIAYPERYLAVEEKDGEEDLGGELRRYCVECALTKGYAHYKVEKGEQVLTFFRE
jgi:hypothetical protein